MSLCVLFLLSMSNADRTEKFIFLQRLGKKLLHHIIYDCIFAMSLYDQGLDKISYSHGTLSLHFCSLFVPVPISDVVCPSPLLSLDPKIVEGTLADSI